MEVETLKSVKHPHLVSLFGTYSHKKIFFLLLQPFATRNLDTVLHQGEITILANNFLNWILDCFSAVAYLHENGIVHRDIKPENIVIDRDMRLYVTDFGLSKMSETPMDDTATISSTETYKAPCHVLPAATR